MRPPAAFLLGLMVMALLQGCSSTGSEDPPAGGSGGAGGAPSCSGSGAGGACLEPALAYRVDTFENGAGGCSGAGPGPFRPVDRTLAKLDGDHLVVASSLRGLSVVALPTDAPGSLLGSARFSGRPALLDVRDGTALVATDDELALFDLSEPAAPTPIGRRSLRTRLLGGARLADFVYLLGDGRLFSLDLADPASPVEAGSVALPAAELTRSLFDPERLQRLPLVSIEPLAGGLLLVAASGPGPSWGRYDRPPTFAAWVPTPAEPRGALGTPLLLGSGGEASVLAVQRLGELLVVVETGGVTTQQLSPAGTLETLGRLDFDTPLGAPPALALDGTRLHVAAGDLAAPLRVIELADPRNPTLLEGVMPTVRPALRAAIRDRELLLLGGGPRHVELTRLDLSHGGPPTVLEEAHDSARWPDANQAGIDVASGVAFVQFTKQPTGDGGAPEEHAVVLFDLAPGHALARSEVSFLTPEAGRTFLPVGSRLAAVSGRDLSLLDPAAGGSYRAETTIALADHVHSFVRLEGADVTLASSSEEAGGAELRVSARGRSEVAAGAIALDVPCDDGHLFGEGASAWLFCERPVGTVTSVQRLDLSTPSAPHLLEPVELPVPLARVVGVDPYPEPLSRMRPVRLGPGRFALLGGRPSGGSTLLLLDLQAAEGAQLASRVELDVEAAHLSAVDGGVAFSWSARGAACPETAISPRRDFDEESWIQRVDLGDLGSPRLGSAVAVTGRPVGFSGTHAFTITSRATGAWFEPYDETGHYPRTLQVYDLDEAAGPVGAIELRDPLWHVEATGSSVVAFGQSWPGSCGGVGTPVLSSLRLETCPGGDAACQGCASLELLGTTTDAFAIPSPAPWRGILHGIHAGQAAIELDHAAALLLLDPAGATSGAPGVVPLPGAFSYPELRVEDLVGEGATIFVSAGPGGVIEVAAPGG